MQVRNFLLSAINIIVAIGVGSCPHGNIRLVGGSTNREGAVEICVNGIWGGICSYQWDSREVQVICRQLGLNTVLGMYIHILMLNESGTESGLLLLLHMYNIIGPIPILNSRRRFDITSNRPKLLDYPQCHGNETNLLNCTHNGIGVVSSYCGSSREAGVICPGFIIIIITAFII